MTTAQSVLAILLLIFSCACTEQTKQSKPALFAINPQISTGPTSTHNEISHSAEVITPPLKAGPIPSVKQLVAAIAKGNLIEGTYIGNSSSPSTQWATYEMLKNTATEKQLVALTDHKNTTVRCYAFQALAAKQSPQTFNVLLRHLHDTARVVTYRGCLITSIPVGDYCTMLVEPGHGNPKDYKLTRKQAEILDSLYLYDNSIHLLSKASALMRARPTEKNYAIIRKLVQTNRDETALIALAKYRKPSDRKLIATFFKNDDTQYSFLDAVVEYPDEYFYPFVVKAFDQEWIKETCDHSKWQRCYKALAKYPKQKTVVSFAKTTEIKDKFRHRTLCIDLLVAITKYPSKMYESLKEKIKLDDTAMANVQEGVHDRYY